MAKLFAVSGDPDKMTHSVVSNLGLHYGSSDYNGLVSTHNISFCGEIRKNYFVDTLSYLELGLQTLPLSGHIRLCLLV